VGDSAVWKILKERLEDVERRERGDWRVRLLVHAPCTVEVQVVPAPQEAGPFQWFPLAEGPAKRRPLVLDAVALEPGGSETSEERDLRLYKTTNRAVYDDAARRGNTLTHGSRPEVFLHTSTHLLETTTSNVALYDPLPGQPDWVTPALDTKERPFLDGVMRGYLLEEAVIREGEVTLSDWERCKADGRRVIGFNGLRGVWEAAPV